MMTKSPSRKTRLLPTGGFRRGRFASIQRLKLRDCSGSIRCVAGAIRVCYALAILLPAWERVMLEKSVKFVRSSSRDVVSVGLLLTALSLAGCSHLPSLHWPWHHKPAPPPPQVHELDEASDGGAAATFPQY